MSGPAPADGTVPLDISTGQQIADAQAASQAPDTAAAPASPPPADGGDDEHAKGIHGLKKKVTGKKEELKDKAHPPGGYDPTPLPDFPSGWTVKFVFSRAENLPAADLSTQACDPYIHATLTAPIPRRHKEDPALTWRTRTIRTTCEPVWDEEWIVANVPESGFKLKCRLFDEDYPDHDDRLGNVTFETSHIGEGWGLGPDGQWFDIKKRMASKRAYFFKAITSTVEKGGSMTGRLNLKIEVLGPSQGKGSQMYTVGPSIYFKHFSPLLGRLTGIKVNKDEAQDEVEYDPKSGEKRIQKYDFQSNELQLSGPVPEHLYHRYVEFSSWVGSMFTSTGLRGKVLHKALHKQHNRIYSFSQSTQWGSFQPCTEEASLAFLRMAHFDEGGRVFTYVLTLDGLLRFTETGKEFGIDFLSKHTMHSDVATYIACSGEFFVRRLAKADAPEHQGEADPGEPTHPSEDLAGGPPNDPPPADPKHYQLVIDNDSGTYRPDKSVLPLLREFLQRNFPGLSVVVLHWEDDEDQKLKEKQRQIKKKEGGTVQLVQNRSPDSSSISSSDESRLDSDGEYGGHKHWKSKKEAAWDIVEDPHKLRDLSLGGKSSENAAGHQAEA
ncbi:c2 domain-containing protein [Diaporthe amygdali]|uniref:c2 domain-containing protein n=1 Tax=Phomopsis amygdali TaxID=1214568 RepID=UPI0022FE8511|nr:c2 domain-containing protein [Diaporthe amygdali]KAJ0120666.1 c2 domain-containing protein [Diaporthe amygdali]